MNVREEVDHRLRGRIKIVAEHEVTKEKRVICEQNLVVNGTYSQLSRLLSGDLVDNTITKLDFGTDGTAPTIYEVALQGPLGIWLTVSDTYPSITTVTFGATWASDQVNTNSIREVGLFTEDNTLCTRAVFQEMKKSEGWTWTISWTLYYTLP